jgi:hypothetical protein
MIMIMIMMMIIIMIMIMINEEIGIGHEKPNQGKRRIREGE